jgi:hypothetical protein
MLLGHSNVLEMQDFMTRIHLVDHKPEDLVTYVSWFTDDVQPPTVLLVALKKAVISPKSIRPDLAHLFYHEP